MLDVFFVLGYCYVHICVCLVMCIRSFVCVSLCGIMFRGFLRFLWGFFLISLVR